MIRVADESRESGPPSADQSNEVLGRDDILDRPLKIDRVA